MLWGVGGEKGGFAHVVKSGVLAVRGDTHAELCGGYVVCSGVV